MSIEFTREVVETVERIKPLLAGKGAPAQGAILATLTALWLHGHVLDDPTEQREVWDSLIAMQTEMIRDLIEAEE